MMKTRTAGALELKDLKCEKKKNKAKKPTRLEVSKQTASQ